MIDMALVVSFVSQKGGVGKSTLARALATVAVHGGLRVRLIDLDPQQQTVKRWHDMRTETLDDDNLSVEVHADYSTIPAGSDDVTIIDAPGRSSRMTWEIARHAHLTIIPTGPSLDDLYPTVLLLHELVARGLPHDRLVVALCRVLGNSEEKAARHYVEQAGYHVLPGALPEHVAYRDAQNAGRSVVETSKRDLNQRADTMIQALLDRITAQVKNQRQRDATAKGKRAS